MVYQNFANAVSTATCHRLSSSEERTAHNREVAGSTPAGGIYHFRRWFIRTSPPLSLQQHSTGMAQRQRARLITLRTQDRSLLPVFIISGEVYQNFATAVFTATLTGMAQWERAGLITPRSLVRVQFPVFIISGGVYQNFATAVSTATCHRLSSSEERTAHNREVAGSTPAGGITFLCGQAGPGVLPRL